MHKGTYLIAAVLFCTAALAACGASNSASLAPSPDSMTTWVAQGSMDGQDGMGGQDTQESMDGQPEELPDLDAVLLVHCRTGVRSKQASDKLLEIGYKNVYDFGGIVDWPYETVTED